MLKGRCKAIGVKHDDAVLKTDGNGRQVSLLSNKTGLTKKNKDRLRPLDDAAVLQRLYNLAKHSAGRVADDEKVPTGRRRWHRPKQLLPSRSLLLSADPGPRTS